MDLNELRNKTDGIDNEIVKLFTERMKTVAEVGRFKQENDIPVFNRHREDEILNKVTESVPEDLKDYTRTLYRTIFELSRSYQGKIVNSQSESAQINITEG